MEIIKRVRGIVRQNSEPEYHDVLWLHRNKQGRIIMEYWEDGNWVPCVDGATAYIFVGDEEPADKTSLWVSGVDTTEYRFNNTVIQNIYARMFEIEDMLTDVNKLVKYGAIVGDATSSAKTPMIESAEPITPDILKEDSSDENEGSQEPKLIEPEILKSTLPALSIRMDTNENLIKEDNMKNYVSGELIWVTDRQRLYIYTQDATGVLKFIPIGTGKSSSGVSIEEVMAFFFNYLGFISNGNKQYRVEVNDDGKLLAYQYKKREDAGNVDDVSKVYIGPRFNINSIFCGGEGASPYSFKGCTHNFIELANGGTEDISLDSLYLLYCPRKGSAFTHILPLKGTVKAGSTFLIRGAQCAIKTNTTVINVDNYDMEWYDEDGKLIQFSQENPCFYLCYGKDGKIYDENGSLLSYNQNANLANPYNSSVLRIGYVDFVGINTDANSEGASPVALNGSSYDNLLFVRYFTLDPVSQANKTYNARKSNSLWTSIDLLKEANESYKNPNEEGAEIGNPMYYYSRQSKIKFEPKATEFKKNIFSTKTVFSETKPNMVNITFGIQATDNGSGATRCFNWISVGYYDEYLEYRKKGTNEWIRVMSFNGYTEYPNKVYNRIRWVSTNNQALTTHKVIVRGLNKGKYEYRVGRLENISYISEIFEFDVKNNSDVTSFDFIQTSDQQGFNWLEYQAWKKSAYFISKKHNVDFTINTGDITQNGNRENEWLDYYEGRKYLRDKVDMFTIGNNDLCGKEEYLLGTGAENVYKINHNNIMYYYTFEVDKGNSIEFTSGEISFLMPSLYSFNYGDYHFVSVNSEFKESTSLVYGCEPSGITKFKEDVYKQMVDWFEKDIKKWKGEDNPTDCSKCIVFMHEMPFTIIIHTTINGTSGRGGSSLNGSKLNETFTGGQTYYWSRLFKKYGIRLIMGGHKHTYSISKPIYDAPEGYIDESTHTVRSDADLFGEISNEMSLKPVIQVLNASEIPSNPRGRYEVVSKINAPIYVMSQATGYKLVSNKEVPCREDDRADWLFKYFPGTPNGNSDAANGLQYHPTYVHYELGPNTIKVHSYQIKNIYSTPTVAKGGSFNINKQSTDNLRNEEIVGTDGYTINL